jgi:hypothetical protein
MEHQVLQTQVVAVVVLAVLLAQQVVKVVLV